MPTTEFDKQKEVLINNIRTEITEIRELDLLIALFNKIMIKKDARAKRSQKARKAFIVQAYYSRTRVPAIVSLQSTNNVTHEEALEKLHKMIETWK